VARSILKFIGVIPLVVLNRDRSVSGLAAWRDTGVNRATGSQIARLIAGRERPGARLSRANDPTASGGLADVVSATAALAPLGV
jgi:hypothetical protein